MLFSKYLNAFLVYNILLIFLFSLSINYIQHLVIINLISYTLLHFLLIYLCLNYFRKTLYLVFFLYGLGIDILLLNQIGRHLLFFMLLLIFFRFTKKSFNRLNPKKIYISILFLQIIILLFEKIFAYFVFGYDFNLYSYFNLVVISFILSYPIFFLFSKIDRYK